MRKAPPFLGGIGVFLSLIYVTKQLAEGINSLIPPPISAPQVMSADATAVFKPLQGELRQPLIITMNISLEELISSSQKGRETKGASKQLIRKGDFNTANEEFEALQPQSIEKIQTVWGEGKVGFVEGKKVILRPGSSEGSPTIEIRNPENNRGFEIRYKNN